MPAPLLDSGPMWLSTDGGNGGVVEELSLGVSGRRECRLVSTEDDRPHEQVAPVDQPSFESLRREVRTSHDEIA